MTPIVKFAVLSGATKPLPSTLSSSSPEDVVGVGIVFVEHQTCESALAIVEQDYDRCQCWEEVGGLCLLADWSRNWCLKKYKTYI